MYFNCEHPSNQMLTPYMVNTQPGWWLHNMRWLDESNIVAIDPSWNWLEGYSDLAIEPNVVHYTRGTPDVEGYENAAYASEWNTYVFPSKAEAAVVGA